MKRQVKMFGALVLALVMVLSCITPVSAATVELNTRPITLKEGAEVLFLMNGGRNGKIGTIISGGIFASAQIGMDTYKLRNISAVKYVDDVAVESCNTLVRHDPGFLIRFRLEKVGSKKQENGVAGYVYASDVENGKAIPVSRGNNMLTVSSDKATIYTIGCHSIGRVSKRFTFTAKSLIVKDGKAYFLLNKKFKKTYRNAYGKRVTKKINVLISASDTTVA